MKIREAYSWDVLEVYDIICLLEKKSLNWKRFKDCYQRQHKDENMHCLVAEERGKIIGCLNLRFEYQLHHADKIAEIMEFCVGEENRSGGIGKKMFDYAVEVARQQGCGKIELCTNQLRIDAHRFYERQGMNNFHYKFSKDLKGEGRKVNQLGA